MPSQQVHREGACHSRAGECHSGGNGSKSTQSELHNRCAVKHGGGVPQQSGGGGSQYSGGQNSPWSELRNKRAVNIHGVGVSQQSGGITVKVMEASPLSLSSTMNVLSQQSGGVS